MSGYQFLLLDRDPKADIATLTLNRPDRRNALNDVIQGEIGDAIEELESTTMEMAQKIAAGPPIAIRLSKLMLYKGLEFDLETAMQMAAAAESITLTSADHAEGTAAFRESRPPFFEDR